MILLSVGKAARLLGVSRLAVQKLIESGRLEAVLLGGRQRKHVRIVYESAAKLLRSNSQSGGPNYAA